MPEQTVEDLGKLVKKKYPAYASMSDAEVGQKVKAKYPQYGAFKDMPVKPAAPEPSFAGKAEQFGIGAAKGLGQTVRNVNKFASFGLSEADPETRQKYDRLLQTKNKYQGYGKTAENVAEGFVPIPGLSEIKAARGAGALAKAGVAAGREALDVGAHTAAQTGSVKQGAAGAALGGALGAAVPLLGHVLEAGAKSQYGKILHPSGRAAQEITEGKLLPKSGEGVKGVGSLLEQKGVVGTSRQALATKFAARTAQATDEMNRAYSALGKNAQVNLKPVLNDFAQFIRENAMLPNGTVPKPSEKLYQEALELGDRLIQDTGGSIGSAPLEDVRKFRQLLDNELFAKKLQINPTTAEDRVQQALRGSIQDVIHSQHPTTAAVDAKVHFWKTAETLMKRAKPPAEKGGSRTLQMGLRGALGGLAGEEYGRRTGGTEQAIEYGFLGAAASEELTKAFGSVAWNSVSAVTKTRIAKLLASGQGQKAADIAARVTGTAAAKTATAP